jgi:hypothetical protein
MDAREWGESIEGGKGIVCGINVAGLGFFPVWELNSADNQELLAARRLRINQGEARPRLGTR